MEICVASRGQGVVAIHGIDGFRELSATAFVDTAGVDPHPLVAMTLRELAAAPDLLANEVAGIGAVLRARILDPPDILECLFACLVPDVGERTVTVRDILGRDEEVKLSAVGAEEPHARVLADDDYQNVLARIWPRSTEG